MIKPSCSDDAIQEHASLAALTAVNEIAEAAAHSAHKSRRGAHSAAAGSRGSSVTMGSWEESVRRGAREACTVRSIETSRLRSRESAARASEFAYRDAPDAPLVRDRARAALRSSVVTRSRARRLAARRSR
jgi:hypothetical protein